MKLLTINTGYFKLDGGAMFGVVPKTIWNKLNPADDNNMCTWAMRCMLIEDGKRLILIDNGIGNKQDEKFFSHYYLHGNDSLELSLRNAGYHADDITDVFLTHLHFDHCGGSIQWNSSRNGYEPAFKNAIYWSHADHWKWATEPNAREKASFLKENILPIKESGQLKLIAATGNFDYGFEMISQSDFHPSISLIIARGHTDAMMLPVVNFKGKTIVFMADLLPSAAHIPIPYVMAYDTRPLITLQEKKAFLEHAAKHQWNLFFEHDPLNECCTIKLTEKGIRPNQVFPLKNMV
jgi:glyoxylase-like metal-dependent hydrolase (beta-lactamase superfamily II)